MDITAFSRRSNGYPRQQQQVAERSTYAARSPLSKAASTGFAYVKQQQPAYPSANSQPQVPSPKTYVTDGFSSLPRPKRKPGQPAQRRKEVNNVLQGYLKSLGSMARSIVLEKETVKQEHSRQWTNMDDAAKEEAVNDHFIPQDIRIQYTFDFPIDRSVSRSSYCSVPPGWPARPHSAHSMNDGGLHHNSSLSQPNNWEDDYQPQRSIHSSKEDLSYQDHTLMHRDQSLSLSQPSLSYNYENNQDTAHNTSFSRLHKQQLSFRPSRKQHAVKKPSPLPSSQLSRLPPQRRGLGSDGESPRTTSDEDFESRNSRRLEQPMAQLGFQRSKLRSFSVRSKRSTSASRSNSNRGSMRAQRRKQTSPENNRKTTDSTSRPSHYHTYSTTSTDTDYDAEIDLPEASLLLDHLQGSPENEARLQRRNSRTRRSLKNTPKLVLHNPSPPGTLTRQPTLDSSTDDLDIDDIDESILDEPLHRADSHDSLDTTTPSKSYPQSDDDALSTTASEISRLTPDSMLSCSSFTRPKSKQAESAILRNRRGKWGGSSYRHVTSNFADRHTQFKANKIRGSSSTQTSASNTRTSTPADLSTGEDRLKPPRFSKYGSVTDSVTSDLPRSPDHLVSPPATPSAVLGGNATYLFSEKRESGYISSSSESFPIRR